MLAVSRSLQPNHGSVQPLVFHRQTRCTLSPAATPLPIHHQKYGDDQNQVTRTANTIHFRTRNQTGWARLDVATRTSRFNVLPMDMGAAILGHWVEGSNAAMGMAAGLYRASESELQQLLGDPASVKTFFDEATWAPPVREVRPGGILGWLLKLSPVTVQENDPDAVPPPGYNAENDRPHCDLEGTWHGLHFLFTGTAWEGEEPACYLLRGGEDIGDADELGYSVLQALSPVKTQRFAEFLGSLSREALVQRFDPKRMTELKIAPGSWGPDGVRNARFRHVLDAYDELRAFVEVTADTNAGLLIYLG